MSMRFYDLYTGLITKSDNSIKTEQAKTFINDAIEDMLNTGQLPAILGSTWLTTVAPYSTGTITVVNGSKTVTGLGTTFTSAMVGRRLRISDGPEIYRIAGYTSALVLTLDEPFIGTSAGTLGYTIEQDILQLPWDVQEGGIEYSLQHADPAFMEMNNRISQAQDNPSPTALGTPKWYHQIERSTRSFTYADGTASITAASKTLTGVGTAWAQPTSRVAPGDLLTITTGANTDTLQILKIVSDTEIRVCTAAANTHAGKVATIVSKYPYFQIQLTRIPDATYNIHVKYYRMFQALIDDTDILPVPFDYRQLIMKQAMYYAKDYDNANEGSIQRAQYAVNQQVEGLAKKQLNKAERHRRLRFDEADGTPSNDQTWNGPISSS